MAPPIDSFPVPGESRGRRHALADQRLQLILETGVIALRAFLVEEGRVPPEVKWPQDCHLGELLKSVYD